MARKTLIHWLRVTTDPSLVRHQSPKHLVKSHLHALSSPTPYPTPAHSTASMIELEDSFLGEPAICKFDTWIPSIVAMPPSACNSRDFPLCYSRTSGLTPLLRLHRHATSDASFPIHTNLQLICSKLLAQPCPPHLQPSFPHTATQQHLENITSPHITLAVA
jgi:hypothetical protein